MKYPFVGAAIGALSLTGCILPPPDKPVDRPVTSAAVGLSAAPAPAIAEDWWKAYADPQFDRLVDQALNGSPTLNEAVARLRIAAAETESARAAEFPQASLGAEETRQRFSGDDIYPPPFARNVYWRGDITASLSWDVDFWGRQAALVAQARNGREAARLDLAAAQLALTSALAQAYADLYHAYALTDVASRTLAQNQDIYEITRRRLDSGLDTNVELRETEGAVAQSKVALEQAESQKALAIHEIGVLTGTGAKAYATIQRPQLDPEAVLPLPASLPADLLIRRPDILAARLRIDAAVSGRDAAKAAFYPDISLNGFTGLSAIGLNDLFRYSSFDYGLGPTIHLPLFDAGRLKAQYRDATARIDDAVAVYNETVLQAVQEAADSLTEIASLSQQSVNQKSALDDAQAAYDLADARYRAGVTDYLSVLNAENALLTAQRSAADIAAEQLINRIRLLVAVGGSFEPSRNQPFVETATVPTFKEFLP